MIAGPSVRGLKYLAGGAYGRVYATKDDAGVVIKRAENDGTRDYLEWVVQRTLEGRRMRGMPWVYGLWPDGPEHYRVSMRRYFPLLRDEWRGPRRMPPHLKALIAAFERETGLHANDVHHGNVMQDDDGEWVLLDPSADAYSGVVLH